MKCFVIVFMVLFALPGYAQHSNNKHSIHTHPGEADNAHALALRLASGQRTDLDKVRAIFGWITANISYHTRPWNQRYKSSSKYEVEDPSDTATILKPLDERVADLVIRRGEAFCDGYARLFKILCQYSGINAVTITGYSRTGMDKGGARFRSNHTWNAVQIDSTWHLLDVTWASGFVTFAGNEFIRRYDGTYFLTPPTQFINDHYPEDLQWTLMDNPPLLREFSLSPFKQQGFIRSKITSFKPEKGLIRTTVGDTLLLELETTAEPEPQYDTYSFYDSAFQYQSAQWIYLRPNVVANGKLTYYYPVTSANIEYLNLVFNDNTIMRYRLEVTQPQTVAAAPL